MAVRAALVLLASLAASTAFAGPPEILVSRQLAKQRGIEVGDVVRLSADPGGAGSSEYRVAGIYEPVPDPMSIGTAHFEARMHLPDLLALARKGEDGDAVDGIHVRLRNPEDAGALRSDLALRAPMLGFLSAADAGSASVGTFRVLERFHLAISIVTVLGSTAFLLALLVMRADERRELAGILRLVGFSRGRILLQVLLEGIAVASAGAVFGVALAAGTQRLVNAFFQAHYDTALVFVRVTPRIAATCVGTAVPLGVVAGLVASWALLRRDVVDLLRR
jgi:putative ABC transport system permease protein